MVTNNIMMVTLVLLCNWHRKVSCRC